MGSTKLESLENWNAWSITFEYFSLLLGSNPDFKRHTQLLWWRQTYLQKSILLVCLTKSLSYIGPLLEVCNHRSVSNTKEDKNHSILYLSSLLWEVKKCPLHSFLKNFFSLSPITSQRNKSNVISFQSSTEPWTHRRDLNGDQSWLWNIFENSPV